jgi:hypothetical protein
MRAKPEYYREQARRTRELAARAKEKDIKANLFDVADRYDQLAVSAEHEPQPPNPRPEEMPPNL